MYTTSILSGCKPDANIEEMHYIQVSLYRGLRKVLEKHEVAANDKSDNDAETDPNKRQSDSTNMLDV